MFLFKFEELATKTDKATKDVIKEFKKNGVEIIKESVSVSKAKRSSGISFKELNLTTTDSRQVQFAIKNTGDIFKVKIGVVVGAKTQLREMPIQHQDDHKKAIKEIANRLERDRKTFQKKLAKLQKEQLDPKVKDKMKTAAKTQLMRLQEENKQLDEDIAQADKRIAELKASVGG